MRWGKWVPARVGCQRGVMLSTPSLSRWLAACLEEGRVDLPDEQLPAVRGADDTCHERVASAVRAVAVAQPHLSARGRRVGAREEGPLVKRVNRREAGRGGAVVGWVDASERAWKAGASCYSSQPPLRAQPMHSQNVAYQSSMPMLQGWRADGYVGAAAPSETTLHAQAFALRPAQRLRNETT